MSILEIVLILIQIESGGDPLAVGDGGRAVGCLQIHPIMVEECQRVSGIEFTLEDRLCEIRSVLMCATFLRDQRERYRKRYDCEPSDAAIASSWNTGGIFKPLNAAYVAKFFEAEL